jgi:1-acyl-sn-glycerol-3-phosphate acyltransferase
VWLSRVFPQLGRAAAFVFYRIRFVGEHVPSRGPALLVANHQNALIDPALVAAAARRPVRFLAKAPLFDDPRLSWAVRASGAIPVYRRADDPALMSRNQDTFRAAQAALAHGAAVGIFPEGMSHSEPSLAPLKTGAARIALGAAAIAGGPVPIVPIGLTFRAKDIFRSDALVLRGTPVEWNDLAARDPEDAEAVRILTERITDALRAVTVNLERWQDKPLIDCALDIWETERGSRAGPEEWVTRVEVATRILADLRGVEKGGTASVRPAAAGPGLVNDIADHERRLRRLGLRPGILASDLGLARGVSWAARRVSLLLPLAALVAVAGFLLFWPPYRLTGWIVGRLDLSADQRSTYKVLIGAALYGAWLLLVTIFAARTIGWLGALLVLAAMPAIGMAGLSVRERWRGAWADARQWLWLRGRRSIVTGLRERQRTLADRLDAALQAYGAQGAA